MLAAALAAVLVAAVPAVASEGIAAISQRSIAGVQLGMTKAQVVAVLGKPNSSSTGTHDNPGQPEDWARVVFPKRKVAVYFRDGSDGAVLVTTWNGSYKTAAGIGPCAPITR